MIHQKIETPVDSSIQSRAMLVSLKISSWSGRKQDKAVTKKMNEIYKAAPNSARANKDLIGRAGIQKLESIVGAARAEMRRMTLPWLHNGVGIISAEGFAAWAERMRELREEFEQVAAEFVADFPRLKEAAREENSALGLMFNESDYPSPADLAQKFRWSTQVFPMPNSDDFRVALDDETAAEIKAQIDAQTESAIESAMATARERLFEKVSHMAKALSEYRPKTGDSKASGAFHASLVENLRDLVDVLPTLNLTGDSIFAAHIDDVRDRLTQYDSETLKTDETARKETQKAAADIADAMGAFMGG